MRDLVSPRNENVRRRNVSLALAIVLFAVSSTFIFGADGMVWLMWRDAPLVALSLFVAAAVLFVRWWRTPRS